MTLPYRLAAQSPELVQVLDLIRASFAYMDGIIAPPSSMHHLTVESLARAAEEAEVWAIGVPPVACVVFTPKRDALYIGKLAVAPLHRKSGLARDLIALAETRAQSLGYDTLELQVRVELTSNQATFIRLGFVESGRTAHPGYTRPTSITYRKTINRLKSI